MPRNVCTNFNKPSYPGRANFSYVYLENALKRLNAGQGGPPTLGGTAFFFTMQTVGAGLSQLTELR